MSKVVLITGASSGLGRSIAEKLSNHDFIVYGTSRNPKEIDAKYKMLKFDITEYEDAERISDYLINKHGKIDVLINNAGISITGPVESSEMSDIKNLYDTNFFLCLVLSIIVSFFLTFTLEPKDSNNESIV